MFRAGVSEAINTREVFYRNRSMTQQSKRSKLLHCRNLSTGLCNPPASIFFYVVVSRTVNFSCILQENVQVFFHDASCLKQRERNSFLLVDNIIEISKLRSFR